MSNTPDSLPALVYSPDTWERFTRPRYADLGSFIRETTGLEVVKGAAGKAETGVAILLALALSPKDKRVVRASFSAFGCPHVVAAADVFCEWAQQRSLDQLREWAWQMLPETLAIPVKKRGRILVLEDAVRTAARRMHAV